MLFWCKINIGLLCTSLTSDFLVKICMKYGTLNYRWLVTLVPGWHIELSLLPTTLRKRSVTLVLCWVIDFCLQWWYTVCHPSSRVRHWTEPTNLRKGSVTPVLCWVNELGLQEWNKGCHPSSRVRHWTEPTTLRKISVTLLLSWSIELNLQHLELKNVPKNSEVGWQESGISPTFHGNRVTPKNIYLSL